MDKYSWLTHLIYMWHKWSDVSILESFLRRLIISDEVDLFRSRLSNQSKGIIVIDRNCHREEIVSLLSVCLCIRTEKGSLDDNHWNYPKKTKWPPLWLFNVLIIVTQTNENIEGWVLFLARSFNNNSILNCSHLFTLADTVISLVGGFSSLAVNLIPILLSFVAGRGFPNSHSHVHWPSSSGLSEVGEHEGGV